MDEPARCQHGEVGAHWYGGEHTPSVSDVKYARIEDVGAWRKWCAGPPRDPLMFEPWRQQLEWQMNLVKHPIDGVHRIDGKWEAWLDGKLVAAGPTKEIIEAAYEHRTADISVAYRPSAPLEFIEIDVTQVPDDVIINLSEGTDWKIPSELRHERLTTEELHTVQMLHDKFQVQKDVDVEAAREMVARFQEVHGEKWRQVFTLAAAANDSLKDFVPMGWFSPWGERWYADTPIYDQLCAETGLYPAGNASHHGVTSA